MNSSRYEEKKFVEFINNDNDIIRDQFMNFLLRDSKILYYQINEREQYRIDLITDNLYLNKNLYWILMRLNAILHVEELAAGHIIKYVSLQDIESAYLSWKAAVSD